MTEEDAATIVKLAEYWLRNEPRNGLPVPPSVRRVALAAAIEAPLAAARCPHVMRLAGVENSQVSAAIAGVEPIAMPRWLTVEQAGELLGLKSNSVRWLLRQGKLTGRRSGTAWLVNSRSVARYHPRRQHAA